MHTVHIISVRKNPGYADPAIAYIQSRWPQVSPIMYEDCIRHCLSADAPLPQWYLLLRGEEIIGCAGLITNDFISRGELYPWICALYVEEKHRGRAYGALLLEEGKADCARLGFADVYLATDHIGYYEKYGFNYIGQGHHPWGDESRIYGCPVGNRPGAEGGRRNRPLFALFPKQPVQNRKHGKKTRQGRRNSR